MGLKEINDLGGALRHAYPELGTVRGLAAEHPVYLVGGSVRDLLLGRPRSDIDLVIVGDAAELAKRLGGEGETVEHPRFATAKARLEGHEIDIASARSESYARPGALPDVEPAQSIEDDLSRRDFTINAMALPLRGEPLLVDPHGGRGDLEAGVLRVLHSRSFVDDPTRALRAARYAARFGFAPDAETMGLLREADLATVSEGRREAELNRLAGEETAPHGFELLQQWGLARLRPQGAELAASVAELLSAPPWQEFAPRETTLLAAALGPAGAEDELAEARPERPSEAVALAARHPPAELALARALGADWLDRYLLEWRRVGLEIDGGELLAAGIEQGPAVGRGLAAALRRKLDGELSGREEELRAALAAARGEGG
jgi:tRNA nucleotidyltransferase (CCA-adding enzyme)